MADEVAGAHHSPYWSRQQDAAHERLGDDIPMAAQGRLPAARVRANARPRQPEPGPRPPVHVDLGLCNRHFALSLDASRHILGHLAASWTPMCVCCSSEIFLSSLSRSDFTASSADPP